MKTFIVLFLGVIGIVIGAILFSIGDENTSFQTKFILRLCGLLAFIGSIVFVQRYWRLNK